jgi:hypothetical protein
MALKMIYNLFHVAVGDESLIFIASLALLPLEIEKSVEGLSLLPPVSLVHNVNNKLSIITLSDEVLEFIRHWRRNIDLLLDLLDQNDV